MKPRHVLNAWADAERAAAFHAVPTVAVADTTAPTASVSLASPLLLAGQTSLVTFTFDEVVFDFGLSDLSVAHGTLSALTSSDWITYTATFTPSADTESPVNVISLNMAGVQDGAGNPGVGSVDSNFYTIDTRRPTATSIVVADTDLAAGETSLVTFTFNELVAGFSNASLSVANGSLSAVTSSDFITWTATLTPAAGTSAASNVISLDLSGLMDSEGNAGLGVVTSNTYAVNTGSGPGSGSGGNTPPTASLVVSPANVPAGQSALLTITFSEPVNGFSNADLSVPNGSLSAVTSSDSVTWTATLTPAAGLPAGSNLISLDLGGVTDGQGLAGSGAATSNPWTASAAATDSTAPVFTSASVDGAQLVLTYSDANPLDASAVPSALAFVVRKGSTPINVSGVAVDAAARTVTLTLSQAVLSTDVVTLVYTDPTSANDAQAIQDASGNDAASLPQTAVDNRTPALQSTIRATVMVHDTQLGPGETSSVTISLAEPLPPGTGFFIHGENATVSPASNVNSLLLTARLTPNANTLDRTNVVTVSFRQPVNGAVVTHVAESNNYEVLTTNTAARIEISDATLASGETAQVTITFASAVASVSADGLVTSHATLSGLRAINSTTWVAQLTPDVDTSWTGQAVRLDYSGVTQVQGGQGFGSVLSPSITIDTKPPTVTIWSQQATLQTGQQARVFIQFSEVPKGLSAADFTAVGGTFSNLHVTPDTKVYAADFSVSSSSVPGDPTSIGLGAGTYTDAAGNPGGAATLSFRHTAQGVPELQGATSSPEDGERDVPVESTIRLRFSPPLSADSALADVKLVAVAGLQPVPAQVSIDAQGRLVIDPTAQLSPDADYMVTWPANVLQDADGNKAEVQTGTGPDRYDFRTTGLVDQVVDGAQVLTDVHTELRANPEGSGMVSVQFVRTSVDPVPANRDDSLGSANPGLADVTLALSPDGTPALTVALPAGIGVDAVGTYGNTARAGNAFWNAAITVAPQLPVEFATAAALAAASYRLQESSADFSTLRTLRFNADPAGLSAINNEIVINGQPGDATLHREMVVIDAGRLPRGTLLTLNHIEAAYVVGAVRVTGGAGNNVVFGDGSAQFIVQGEGDDELQGGGGDDVVASRSGDDRLFGDDGNDWVVGGIGIDTLEGGTGDDVLQGGASDAGRWLFQLDAAGHLQSTFSAREAVLTELPAFSHSGAWSDLTQRLTDDRLAYSYHEPQRLQTVALLAQVVLGRLPTLNELNTFADDPATQAQLAELAATAYAALHPAWQTASVAAQVRSLLEAAWGPGPGTEAMVPVGIDAIAQGVSWAQGLLYLAHSDRTVTHFSDASGNLLLAQPYDSPELGWLADSGNDVLRGGDGNDRLVGGFGNDVLDGGAGLDTAVFIGNVADYRLSKGGSASNAEWLLHNRFTGEVDALTSIERLEIGSHTYAWLATALAGVGEAEPVPLVGLVIDVTGTDAP